MYLFRSQVKAVYGGTMCAVAMLALAGGAAPAAAQQHLYCADVRGAGLFWDQDPQGEGRVSEVAPESFTVNIVSAERRLINKQVGGVRETVCRIPVWPEGNRGIVTCTDVSGAETWLFNHDRTYTRSYMFGTPLQTEFTDPNITVAHGTCRPY